MLNYLDLGLSSAGGALFMAHQVAKEAMASLGGERQAVRSIGQIAGAAGQLAGSVGQFAGSVGRAAGGLSGLV